MDYSPIGWLPSEFPFGNESLDKALVGLVTQLARQSWEFKLSPKKMNFRTHMDASGTLVFGWSRSRGDCLSRPDGGNMTEIHEWMRARNKPICELLRRCPSLRMALRDAYEKAVRFANDGDQPLAELVAGTARIPRQGPAWLRLYRSKAASAMDMR